MHAGTEIICLTCLTNGFKRMKFLGYITDICQYAIHRYDYQFYGIVWISFMLVYGVFKNLSTAMQLGFIKWILLLHTKSLWIISCISCILYCISVTGQNTVKVIWFAFWLRIYIMHFIVLGFWGGLKSEI